MYDKFMGIDEIRYDYTQKVIVTNIALHSKYSKPLLPVLSCPITAIMKGNGCFVIAC